MRRRRLLRATIALLATSAVALASGCGSSGPGSSSGSLQVWSLQDTGLNPVVKAAIARYNKTASDKATLSTYVNDPYKQKIQVALGTPKAPDIFFNWGGGNLSQFVKEGQVAPLDAALAKNAAVKSAFLPNVLAVGQVDGKQYGLPMTGTQPVILYYNKTMFAKYSLQPPKTFDDMLSLVKTFKSKKITPISLPGKQAWTEMMYPEYFLDRIGGPGKFEAILKQGGDAWKDPAVLKSMELSQQLVKAGAFGTNYASIDYDNTGASKLFATGKAAMYVMGTWDTSTQAINNPSFTKNDMGYTAFPTVAGGAGDPGDVVGNPSNYFSVSAQSKNKDAAADFLVKTLDSNEYVNALIKAGQVPTTVGVESKLNTGDQADFNVFTYKLVEGSKNFVQSWDQALPSSIANEMLTDLSKVFLLQMTPQQFVDDMAKTK
jgi:xylobiose transport system substrate-binding protein